MPNFRRILRPGGTYFFTQVTEKRQPILTSDLARPLLRTAIERTRERWPFDLQAWVLLPDHLHAIWTLPSEDCDYSRRWGFLKKEFTKVYLLAGGIEAPVTAGRSRDGRRGVWQPEFWEHTIIDQPDYERHFHYLHYNPVKHGLAQTPSQYPWSTFHRHVRAGVYEPEWGGSEVADLLRQFERLNANAIEYGE
jgi:putative transposase